MVEFDLASTTTRTEFGLALTAVKERAGLSVRDVADATGIPFGTLGGYFAGTHVPPATSTNLVAILRACGVSDPDEVADWTEALFRVRHAHSMRRARASVLRDPGTSTSPEIRIPAA